MLWVSTDGRVNRSCGTSKYPRIAFRRLLTRWEIRISDTWRPRAECFRVPIVGSISPKSCGRSAKSSALTNYRESAIRGLIGSGISDTTEYGDLYYFISYSSVVRGAGAIFLVAPESGEIIFRRAMSGSQIPVLSADGSVVYLVPRLRGTIRSLDVATGEIRDTESRLPHSVMHAVSHASRKDEAFVVTSDGDLFSVHLPTANHSGPIASVPGAAWIATLPNGRVALANPVRNELVVVDPSGNEPEYAIELTSRIEWIRADPVGPYLYAGAYQESSLRVHLFDSSTLKYQHSLEFPNRLMPTGEAMPKVLSVIDQ